MKKIIKNIFVFCFVITAFYAEAQDTVFMHTYGMQGYNYGVKSLQTSDGGFIILGNKSGFVGNTDIYLIRTNYKGEIIWDKAIGDAHIEWANDFCIALDGGFIITGYSNNAPNNDYNVLVLKTDSNGVMKWSKSYGGSEWDFGKALVQAADSSIIVTGETFSNGAGNSDILLLGMDKNGDSLWSKTYGGALIETPEDIKISQSNELYISGSTNSFGAGNYDGFLFKTTITGDSLWLKTYGDTADDKFYGFTFTHDNAIAIAASTKNYNAFALDGMILKTDIDGNKLWRNVFGGTDDDEFKSIIQNTKHQYILLGNTLSFGYIGSGDLYLVLTDQYGIYIYGPSYGLDKADFGEHIALTSNNGCIITGSSESYGQGISNIFIARTDTTYVLDMANCSPISGIQDNIDKLNSFTVFPNPVNENCIMEISLERSQKITFNLCNNLGTTVFENQTHCIAGNTSISIDFNALPSGIYYLNIIAENINITKKIICIK